MQIKRVTCFIALIFGVLLANAQDIQKMEAGRIRLPNGWHLSPAGKSLPLGDLPLNLAISPSHKWMAVTNNGQSDQMIQLIDLKKQSIADTMVVNKSWMGLAFSPDEKYIYASGGNQNCILKIELKDRKLKTVDTFKLGIAMKEKISPAGLCVDSKGHFLYVVTKENNSLYVLDLSNGGKVANKIPLSGQGYTCLLSNDEKTLYISCWGCDKVLLLNTAQLRFEEPIAVGDNPNDMCMSKNGTYLYVANANDNSVSVIDLKKKQVIEVLNAALYPQAVTGSTTNGVALSEDNKTLYIANADNNCIAVFNVSEPGKSTSMGFIPTGWYPTCVRVVGKDIYVANGKGMSSKANPQGPNPAKKTEKVAYQKGETKKATVQYIGGLFRGTLSIIPAPKDKLLSEYSQIVYHNAPYNKDSEMVAKGKSGNPIPRRVGDKSPIKYVFYIIKENRTYDQVLSDINGGNGDTSLLLFGEKVTPNQHALAREFVLLDNFYTDGEVSADGHNWSTSAYATDYLEKTWPTSYGGRGGGYDAEGNTEIANGKKGFIWDFCKRAGVSYRTYGEFADNYKPNIPVLKDHFCTYYTSWDPMIMDTMRYTQWKRDFDSLLTAGKVPQLNTLRLINDHTMGLSRNKPSPFAQVADNDLAVGQFVEHLSHSSIWNESVVFIVEDDAQNGADHVDAHRTTAYVAGGLVKQSHIDHTPYSTSSLLRTIELILGLPPMSQYDAGATPMWRCFSDSPMVWHAPFKLRPSNIDLRDKNMAMNKWSEMSDGLDLTAEDRAPEQVLNQIIWVAVKGDKSTYPAPRRAAFINGGKDGDD